MNDTELTPGMRALIEKQAEAYFAPPRGLNSLWVHWKLMLLAAIVLMAFGPLWSSVLSKSLAVIDPTFRQVMEPWVMVPYWLGGMAGIMAGIIYVVASYRLGLAVEYGLPEPGIREWPAFKQYLKQSKVRVAR